MTMEEQLSAYLDGELEAAERDRLLAALEKDNELRRLAELLRQNDERLRAASRSLVRDEVPERFVRLFGKEAERDRPVPSVPASAGQASNYNRRLTWRLGSAMAASLAIGLLLGSEFARGGSDGLMSAPLEAGLDHAVSGTEFKLASGEQLAPRLTFARKGGGYCRQFQLKSKSATASGIACRSDGDWTLEALMPGSRPSASDGYIVAEGSSDPRLDDLIDSLREGDPLDPAAEAELIRRDWRPAR